MTTIASTILDAAGNPSDGSVLIVHSGPGFTGENSIVLGRKTIDVKGRDAGGEPTGVWSVDLPPTSSFEVANTYYTVTQEASDGTKDTRTITVPDSGTHSLYAVLIDPPDSLDPAEVQSIRDDLADHEADTTLHAGNPNQVVHDGTVDVGEWLRAVSLSPLTVEGVPAPSGGDAEAIQDVIGAMVTDSATVNFTYDDTAGTLTAVVQGLTSADVSGLAEAVDDRVSALLVAGANIALTYDDVANTLTVAVSGVALSGHDHDADYVNEVDHTKGAHDALGIDAATLDGVDSTGFATSGHNHAGTYEPAGTVQTHLDDASDAHDAAAVSVVPAGGIAATNVQAALEELDSEKSGTGHNHSGTYEPAGTVQTHLDDTSAAHTAAAVSYNGSANLSATDVEAALDELDTEKSGTGHGHTTLTANAQAASYTLVLSDAGKVVEISNASAVNLTVPPNSSVAFPVGTILEVHQSGAGQVTVVGGSGVTVNSRGAALKLAGQYATARLRKTATDAWVLVGDVTT